MTPVGTALHFRRENENLSSSADVLHKTKNLAISSCCFADDGNEMDKSEKRTCQGVQSYCFYPLLGSLSNDNGDGNENVTNLHI